MKTAISVPDETFDEASKRAAQLGISRSQFFSDAASRYLHELDAADVTAQIDAVLADLGGRRPDGETEAVAAGRRLLAEADDDW